MLNVLGIVGCTSEDFLEKQSMYIYMYKRVVTRMS